MDLTINGQERSFSELSSGTTVAALVACLNLKGDRVAVERNGAIVSKDQWDTTSISNGDRFEIVHFVGGGLPGVAIFPQAGLVSE